MRSRFSAPYAPASNFIPLEPPARVPPKPLRFFPCKNLEGESIEGAIEPRAASVHSFPVHSKLVISLAATNYHRGFLCAIGHVAWHLKKDLIEQVSMTMSRLGRPTVGATHSPTESPAVALPFADGVGRSCVGRRCRCLCRRHHHHRFTGIVRASVTGVIIRRFLLGLARSLARSHRSPAQGRVR